MWHARVDRRGFGIKQDFIPLFFFMFVQILWQGQKAVLTIVEFAFFDIFYSKFQLVLTFSICSKFCVENWLLCWDLSCKWDFPQITEFDKLSQVFCSDLIAPTKPGQTQKKQNKTKQNNPKTFFWFVDVADTEITIIIIIIIVL